MGIAIGAVAFIGGLLMLVFRKRFSRLALRVGRWQAQRFPELVGPFTFITDERSARRGAWLIGIGWIAFGLLAVAVGR